MIKDDGKSNTSVIHTIIIIQKWYIIITNDVIILVLHLFEINQQSEDQ